MMNYFDYALIRYMPNPMRGEIVNIGLIVFNDGALDVRMISSPKKLRLIDGQSTLDDLENHKSMLVEYASVTDDPSKQYEMLSSTKKGAFLSEKAFFAVKHVNEYDSKVQSLFEELVETAKPRIKRTKRTGIRLSTRIKDQFESLNLLSKNPDDLLNHKIIQDYPIDGDSGLKADFIAKNGSYHLSEVIDFNVSDPHQKIQETSLKIMTFLECQRLLKDVKLYFVYYADSTKESAVSNQLHIAEKYSNFIYNMASQDEQNTYFEKMCELLGAKQNALF